MDCAPKLGCRDWLCNDDVAPERNERSATIYACRTHRKLPRAGLNAAVRRTRIQLLPRSDPCEPKELLALGSEVLGRLGRWLGLLSGIKNAQNCNPKLIVRRCDRQKHVRLTHKLADTGAAICMQNDVISSKEGGSSCEFWSPTLDFDWTVSEHGVRSRLARIR